MFAVYFIPTGERFPQNRTFDSIDAAQAEAEWLMEHGEVKSVWIAPV